MAQPDKNIFENDGFYMFFTVTIDNSDKRYTYKFYDINNKKKTKYK